jgi:hypothetical protein
LNFSSLQDEEEEIKMEINMLKKVRYFYSASKKTSLRMQTLTLDTFFCLA